MKRSMVVISAVAVIGAAAAGIGYQQISKQNSLKTGVAQTEQALRQVNQQIDENQADAVKLFAGLEVDVGGALPKLVGASNPLNTAIDLFNQGASAYQATKSTASRDYAQGIGKTAEAIANVWGVLNPYVAGGKELIDFAATLYEAQAILRQQANLVETRIKLENQLSRLRGEDPETRAEWQSILQSLHGNPAAEHEAFLKWLAASGQSKKEILAKALSNAANAGPTTAHQFALGTIVDPSQVGDDLTDIPNINPDFIAATQCDRSVATNAMSDPRWLKFTCSKYPDGTYIPAFGPCRGIDIPNPFTGGVIASSTEACRAGTSVAHAQVAAPGPANSTITRGQRDQHVESTKGTPKVSSSGQANEVSSFAALISQISGKPEFHCCVYQHLSECESLRDKVRQEMTGRRLTMYGPPRGGDIIEPKDVNVCVSYSTEFTTTKTVAARTVSSDARKGTGDEHLCSDSADGYVWNMVWPAKGVPGGGTKAYAACVNHLLRTAPGVYESHCTQPAGERWSNNSGGSTLEMNDRQYTATLHVAGDKMSRETREELHYPANRLEITNETTSAKAVGTVDRCFILAGGIAFFNK